MEKGMRKRAFNLGPGSLAESSIESNLRFVFYGNYEKPLMANKEVPDFVMTKEDWYTIQRYVECAKNLPTTKNELKVILTVKDISDKHFEEFGSLISAYINMKEHVKPWKDTYEKSVHLASDIVNYSLKVPTQYNEITRLAEILVENPDDQKAKDKLIALLNLVRKIALGYKEASDRVYEEIKKFAELTESDMKTLCGSDGKSGLKKTYEDKFGAKSEEGKKLADEIKKAQEYLNEKMKEYDHDVVVASTSPTYCWALPPLGLVASAVVAGVYGKKATDTLNEIKDINARISKMQEQQREFTELLKLLHYSSLMVVDISSALRAAVPLIQKIQGIWNAIADDIGDIIKGIDQSIEDFLPIIMEVFAATTVAQWVAVGKAADKYRLNAFITIVPVPAEVA